MVTFTSASKADFGKQAMPWASFSIKSPRHQPVLPSQITSGYHFSFYPLRLWKSVSLKCFSYTVSDMGLVCVYVCVCVVCICVSVCVFVCVKFQTVEHENTWLVSKHVSKLPSWFPSPALALCTDLHGTSPPELRTVCFLNEQVWKVSQQSFDHVKV